MLSSLKEGQRSSIFEAGYIYVSRHLMNKKQEIEDLFNILHNGIIINAEISSTDVELTVSIPYLAELINENHEFVKIVLESVKKIEFKPWTNEFKRDNSWQDVFDLEIDILSAETIETGEVVIHSRCHNSEEYEFEGGKLMIDCDDYKIYDETARLLTLDKMKEISIFYWNEKFGKK